MQQRNILQTHRIRYVWSYWWSWVMSLCVYSLHLWQVMTIRASPQWLQKGNTKTFLENNKKDCLESGRIISLNIAPEKVVDKIHLKTGTWKTRLWLATETRAYNVWPIVFPFVTRFLAFLWKQEKWLLNVLVLSGSLMWSCTQTLQPIW